MGPLGLLREFAWLFRNNTHKLIYLFLIRIEDKNLGIKSKFDIFHEEFITVFLGCALKVAVSFLKGFIATCWTTL